MWRLIWEETASSTLLITTTLHNLYESVHYCNQQKACLIVRTPKGPSCTLPPYCRFESGQRTTGAFTTRGDVVGSVKCGQERQRHPPKVAGAKLLSLLLRLNSRECA